MQSRILFFCLALFCVGLAANLRAEFLVCTIPDTDLQIILPGRCSNSQGNIEFTPLSNAKEHLFFPADLVQVKKVSSTQQEVQRRMLAAGSDPDEVFKAACGALKRGLLNEFNRGITKTLDLSPKHEGASQILALRKQMEKALPESGPAEAELKSLVNVKSMRIARSPHFVMLHDTPDKPAAGEKPGTGKKKNRAEDRLVLLEQAYETFLLYFRTQDVELDVPRERMKVILFNDRKDYVETLTKLAPPLSGECGFWDPAHNVSVFFDRGTPEAIQGLESYAKEIQQKADESKKQRSADAKVYVQRANTIGTLIKLAQDNTDLESVSHEIAHQMAGSTGLFPPHVMVPIWVHEGLAT